MLPRNMVKCNCHRLKYLTVHNTLQVKCISVFWGVYSNMYSMYGTHTFVKPFGQQTISISYDKTIYHNN
jgi:hypothetical protein